MVMTHSDLLKLLLPSSIDTSNAGLVAELTAVGNQLDLVLGYADQILQEADPRTVAATLPDWERVYGLPEDYVRAQGIAQSFQERRAALVVKVTMQGGQSAAFFIALAAKLGYTISITEGHVHTTELDTEDPVMDEQFKFIWYVNAPLINLRQQTTEDDSEMALATWGNTLLEATINKYKPAHTCAIFTYA